MLSLTEAVWELKKSSFQTSSSNFDNVSVPVVLFRLVNKSPTRLQHQSAKDITSKQYSEENGVYWETTVNVETSYVSNVIPFTVCEAWLKQLEWNDHGFSGYNPFS